MKLATNNHHVSGNCWKGFHGQRSKGRDHSKTKCIFAANVYISTVWRRGSLCFQYLMFCLHIMIVIIRVTDM